MPKRTKALSALLFCAAFASCQKEVSIDTTATRGTSGTNTGTGNSNGFAAIDYLGTYKVISFAGNTTTTSEMTMGSDAIKVVSIMDYLSSQASGTVRFNATTMSTENVAYSFATTLVMKTYTNNVLQQSADMPVDYNMPASSATAAYKLVGTDSIYISGGSMLINDASLQSAPAGAKLKLEGKRLTMTMNVNQNLNQVGQGGIQVRGTGVGTSVITMEKI